MPGGQIRARRCQRFHQRYADPSAERCTVVGSPLSLMGPTGQARRRSAMELFVKLLDSRLAWGIVREAAQSGISGRTGRPLPEIEAFRRITGWSHGRTGRRDKSKAQAIYGGARRTSNRGRGNPTAGERATDIHLESETELGDQPGRPPVRLKYLLWDGTTRKIVSRSATPGTAVPLRESARLESGDGGVLLHGVERQAARK
jgi:hypothetical protein